MVNPAEIPELSDKELDSIDTALCYISDAVLELKRIMINNRPQFYKDDLITLQEIQRRLSQIFIIGENRL